MAYLVWARKEKLLLKVQEGTGDNLSREDIENGFVDYVLWSTFRPQCLDLDQELPMEAIDGGMVMFEELLPKDHFVPLPQHSSKHSGIRTTPPTARFCWKRSP